MNKRELTEADIRSKFIKPAIVSAGWADMEQIREEVSITDGRIVVRGKLVSRGRSKRADYVLNYQNLHRKCGLPTAVNTAFWWDTPADMKQRLGLEAELIARWRSPFNKENWRFWGTPFVGKG